MGLKLLQLRHPKNCGGSIIVDARVIIEATPSVNNTKKFFTVLKFYSSLFEAVNIFWTSQYRRWPSGIANNKIVYRSCDDQRQPGSEDPALTLFYCQLKAPTRLALNPPLYPPQSRSVIIIWPCNVKVCTLLVYYSHLAQPVDDNEHHSLS